MALAGCGSSAASHSAPPPARSSTTATTVAPGSSGTLSVSGTVARTCPGPLIVGRRPHCQDIAVFARGGHRIAVRGRFHVRLAAGAYVVTVDGCPAVQVIKLSRPLTGLQLIPRCAVPT